VIDEVRPTAKDVLPREIQLRHRHSSEMIMLVIGSVPTTRLAWPRPNVSSMRSD
jgi:hypothetical protein